MIVVTANEDKKLHCITCWEECSTGMFERIVDEWEPDKPKEERSPVLLFSILTGTDYKITLQAQDDELETAIYQCVAFVYVQEMFFKDEDHPEIIEINDKRIVIPTKLGSMTVEQNMLMRRALEGKRLEANISLAMAVYLQPLVDGTEFDFDRALLLREKIKAMPIWQTYSIGFFFLSKLRPFGSSGLRDSNQLVQMLMWNVVRLLNWLKSKNSNHYMT